MTRSITTTSGRSLDDFVTAETPSLASPTTSKSPGLVGQRCEIDGFVPNRAAKVGALRKRKGMSVRAVLVYEGRLSRRVPADGYFSHLISVDEFLRGR